MSGTEAKINLNNDDEIKQMYKSVKSFGAKGDGSTDDTAAIQKALNSGAKIIYFDGNYLVSSGLVLQELQNVCVVLGSSSIGWHPNTSFASKLFMFTLKNCSNVAIKGGTLAGNNNPSSWDIGNAQNISGRNSNQFGIFVTGSSYIKISNAIIKNFQHGIYTLATDSKGFSHDIVVSDTEVTGCYAGIVWESYMVDGVYDCRLSNVNSHDNYRWGEWMEIGSSPKNSNYIKNIRHEYCKLSNQKQEHGCYVQGAYHSFTNCMFLNNNTAGLRMLACGGVRVIGCRFEGNGKNRNGIGYQAPALFIGEDTTSNNDTIRSNNIIITGNTFKNNRAVFMDYKLDNAIIFSDNTSFADGDSGTDSLISFRSTQNSKITNNIFKSGLANSCILIRDQGNSISENIKITDNIIKDHTGEGIRLFWSASAADCGATIIDNNLIDGATGDGLVIWAAARTVNHIQANNNRIINGHARGIYVYIAAKANLHYLDLRKNVIISNAGYAILFDGENTGNAFGISTKDTIYYSNNANGKQVHQQGSAAYAMNFWATNGDRIAIQFSAKNVPTSKGTVVLDYAGGAKYWNLPCFARVKGATIRIEDTISAGSITPRLKNSTGTEVTTFISANLQISSGSDRSVSNSLNSSSDRLSTTKYQLSLDKSAGLTLQSRATTFDVTVTLYVDLIEDYRFETSI